MAEAKPVALLDRAHLANEVDEHGKAVVADRGRLFLYLIRYRLGIWSVEGVANRSRCVLSVFALAYAWFLEVHSHPYRKTCPSSWLNMRIAGSRRSMGCRPTEREAADASIVIVVARRGYLQNHLRLGIDQVGSAIHHRADGACREFWRCPTRPTAPVMWLIMAKFPRIVAFDHVRKAIGFRIGTPTERKFRTMPPSKAQASARNFA